MPATLLKIEFRSVAVLDDDAWGAADWSFKAEVDGIAVGDPNAVFEVNTGTDVHLNNWSLEHDVASAAPGETVRITFEVTEIGTMWNTSKGKVQLHLHYPFDDDVDVHLDGTEEGLIWTERHFGVHVVVTVLAGFSEEPDPALPPIPTPGGNPDGDDFTVVDGSITLPRVEVHPVVPTPAADQLPPRPTPRAGTLPGVDTEHSKPIPLTGTPALNSLANPSLIPIISPGDANFDGRVARLAVTHYRPKNFDTNRFTWHVKKGPVAFHGGSRGAIVKAYATEDSPSLAEIEVRLEGGTPLCLFRAFVGYIRTIPFRANIIAGASSKPRVTPADVSTHIALANVLMFQSGLLLVPDSDKTAFDGATAHAGHPGVFTLNTSDALTNKVDRNKPTDAARLNFRPNVMQLVYIKSFTKAGVAGIAMERPGLSGADVEVGGTPTSSWVRPSGVPPDGDAGTVTMRSMSASAIRSSAADINYVKARGLPESALEHLYGAVFADYKVPGDEDWPQTVAHEVGHVLGLRHRGNGATSRAPGSDDLVDDPNGKGHPFQENVMCYGYTLSQDLDLVQTKCIRKHPCVVRPDSSTPAPAPGVTPPSPPPPPAPAPAPAPAPSTTNQKVVELQNALGDSPADGNWNPSTESAAKAQMVRQGSEGKVVLWVQNRVNEAGFSCGTADEIFGSKTDGAVRRYQQSAGLSVDGVAGPDTMKKLAGVT